MSKYTVLAIAIVAYNASGCSRTGPQGSPGGVGSAGSVGVPGLSCSVSQSPPAPNPGWTETGGAYVTCGGATVFVADGASGSVGLAGATGQQGNPGTSITMIQFCTQYTPTYASSFPESGACIGGNLYAVYDGGATDVFFSLLPPGEYMSTSTDAPCNFSVAANCVVTDN
jgi:hypothetical protein